MARRKRTALDAEADKWQQWLPNRQLAIQAVRSGRTVNSKEGRAMVALIRTQMKVLRGRSFEADQRLSKTKNTEALRRKAWARALFILGQSQRRRETRRSSKGKIFRTTVGVGTRDEYEMYDLIMGR